MKPDKKTIFSVAIVLLFVGSIFAIMTTGSNRTKVPSGDLNSDYNINTAPVNFLAEFDANVSEIFSQIIIAGRPVEYDQMTIETKLSDLQGIKNKNISFRPANDGNISLVITLGILPEKKDEIVSKIKELNLVEEPIELYQYALLSVPEDVNFTNDSNQSMEYYFGATPMEGIIHIDTLKGDNINVSCYASFSGNKLVSATGIEMHNNSSYPQMLVSSGDFNVMGYEPKISLDATTFFISSKDKNYIEIEIKKDYNDTEITYSYSQNLIYDISEDKNLEILKTEMSELKETKISDYSVNEEEKTLEVYLKEDTNDTEYIDIKEQIKILTNSSVITSEPKISTSIVFNYDEIDITKINNILEQYDFTDLKYKTLANVNTENLIIENQKYEYDQNQTQAHVNYPEDLNKTTLTLQIQAYVQRNKILYLGLMK